MPMNGTAVLTAPLRQGKIVTLLYRCLEALVPEGSRYWRVPKRLDTKYLIASIQRYYERRGWRVEVISWKQYSANEKARDINFFWLSSQAGTYPEVQIQVTNNSDQGYILFSRITL